MSSVVMTVVMPHVLIHTLSNYVNASTSHAGTIHVVFSELSQGALYQTLANVNIRITFILLVIYKTNKIKTLTGLNQLRFTLSTHHFRQIMFKCEYQIWSSGFWGTFICSSLNHCITRHYTYVLIIKLSILSVLSLYHKWAIKTRCIK